MNYQPRIFEAGPLSGLVEVAFVLESYSPEHRIERLVPNGLISLVIELDGRERHVLDSETKVSAQSCTESWISGTHTKHILIGDVGPDTRLAAVQFAVGGAHSVLHVGLDALNDKVQPAKGILGEGIGVLRQEMMGCEDPEAALDLLQAYLEARVDPARRAPALVQQTVQAILADPRSSDLTRRVQEEGEVSYKHFLGLFKQHVGPTPKVLQRILRFSQIFEQVVGQQAVDWVQLSLDLGYSDQAHLIRDFKAFSGYRPKRFQEEGHERLNFFPEGEEPEGD